MSKNKRKAGPSKPPTTAVAADPKKQGCATSFLTRERGEMDTECGDVAPNPKQEYVQPDEEKESGGEG